MKNQVARDFKQKVSDKENAAAEAERGMADVQLGVHLQSGKPHIDPVQIRDYIQHEHEGDQTERHPPDSLFLQGTGRRFTRAVLRKSSVCAHGFNLAGEQGFEP